MAENVIMTIALLCGTPSDYNYPHDVLLCQKYYINCFSKDTKSTSINQMLMRCILNKKEIGGDK